VARAAADAATERRVASAEAQLAAQVKWRADARDEQAASFQGAARVAQLKVRRGYRLCLRRTAVHCHLSYAPTAALLRLTSSSLLLKFAADTRLAVAAFDARLEVLGGRAEGSERRVNETLAEHDAHSR